MSFEIPNHHANRKHGWYTADNYQVYRTTGQSMPSNYASAPYYPNMREASSNVNEERVPEAWTGAQMVVNEPATGHGKIRIYKANKEDVDAEANQFIKLEHRRFELGQWASPES